MSNSCLKHGHAYFSMYLNHMKKGSELYPLTNEAYQVGKMTLGGLLALKYVVVVSYKRTSKSVINGNVELSLETIDRLGETYLVLRGTSRQVRYLDRHILKLFDTVAYSLENQHFAIMVYYIFMLEFSIYLTVESTFYDCTLLFI